MRGAPLPRSADKSGAPLRRVEIQMRRTPSTRRRQGGRDWGEPGQAGPRYPGRGRTHGQCEQRRLKELRWSPPLAARWQPNSGSWGRSPRALGKRRPWTTWNLGHSPAKTPRGRLPLADLGTHQRRSLRRMFKDSCPRPPPLRLPRSVRPQAPGPPLLACHGTPCSAPSPNSSATCLRRQMISRATCSTGDA